MKSTLFVLFLSAFGLWAQNTKPGFAPLPDDAAASNRFYRARQALRGGPTTITTNIVATNIVAPGPVLSPSVVVPFTPRPEIQAPGAAGNAGAAPPPAPVPNPTAGVPGQSPAVPGASAPAGPAASTAPVAPASGTAPPEEMIPAGTINFPATDLNQVLKIYGELVGRTILRPATLPAPTITLITQTPLTKKEAIQAFDAVLALNGVATVNVGDKFVKIVPTPQVGQVGMAFNKEPADRLAEMGQAVTHVVQLKFSLPTAMVPVLTPFASPGVANGILPFDNSQILVLRDFSENVKRMLEMIEKIDVAVPSEFVSEVIPIKYALSSDIASALNSLSSGGGGGTTLGAGAGAPGGATRGTGSRGSTGGFNRSGFGGAGGMGGYPGSMGNTPFGQSTPGAVPGAQGSSFTQRLQNIISKAANATGDIEVIGHTKIISDERTNSLLVFASKEDMKTIKDIVSKLDVVLAQVLIEAVIMQVTLNDSQNFGVSYAEKKNHGVGNYFSGIGAINNANMLSQSPLVSGATNAVANNLPGGFSYLAQLGGDLDVSITALAAGSKARILQRPRIQTSHAVPATLFVGQQRPYPVSSYYGGGSFGGYASIQQLQIGVTLEVTPLINPDGLVVMDIHQKIDSFEGNVTIQNVGDVPVTSSKDATAKVAVRDRDTVMLGGLIETDKNSNNSGVPFLKDIPLLGYLFRSSASSEARTELIVLIRPTVLPTPEVAALASRSEKNKMPGIREMEKEIQNEETKRLHAVDRDLKGRE